MALNLVLAYRGSHNQRDAQALGLLSVDVGLWLLAQEGRKERETGASWPVWWLTKIWFAGVMRTLDLFFAALF